MLRELKKIFKHLGFVIGLGIGLVLITLLIIHFYTGHSKKNVSIPSIEGLRIDEAIKILEDQEYKYVITDTVYRDGIDLMTIVDQIPEAGLSVKKGRTIYLVLNTDEIPKLPMPELAGRTSLKEAVQILKIKGLELGEVIERRDPSVVDPSSAPVLDQYLSGDTISVDPGTQIERHSKIDLVVGIMMDSGNEDFNQADSTATAVD
jgi:eukaryotic-like serine/threonine-protein kinase